MKSASLPLSSSKIKPLEWVKRIQAYWMLIKDLQTGLLLLTAIAGFSTACCSNLEKSSLAGLLCSLFLAIGGSTALNMVFDRDIDAKMARTRHRPLPSGLIHPIEALLLGIVMIALGLVWAFLIDELYAIIVASGVFLDIFVYTIWLKRRNPFSILLGGLSGGMPILAARTLALGRLDSLAILLTLTILLWIPTHILTFTIKYQSDYSSAGIPTFPAKFGVHVTRWIIATSTLLTVAAFLLVDKLLAFPIVLQITSLLVGLALMSLVVLAIIKPSRIFDFILYKGASIYMLISMLMIIFVGI